MALVHGAQPIEAKPLACNEREQVPAVSPERADYRIGDFDIDALTALSLPDRLVRLREAIQGPIIFTHGFGIEAKSAAV